MSENNILKVKKTKRGWKVSHEDMDNGLMDKLGNFTSLEEAIMACHKFEEKLLESGVGVEYGINVDLKGRK